MRRICNFLLCFALVLCVLATAVSAAGSSVTLKASRETLSRGDTVTVVAELSNTEKIGLGNVSLEYDTKVFELVSGQCHVDGAALGQVLPEDRAGIFLFMLPKAVSGKIFTFELKVRNTAPLGAYTISGVASTGVDAGSTIPVTGAQVTVALPTVNAPEATVQTAPPTQAVQPQTPDGVTVPQATQETTESTELSSPETTEPIQTDAPAQTDVPAQTDAPAREDASKETKMRWTGPIAALILGVIGVGVKLFRKEKE